jgi:hypothetical protein
MDVEKNRRSELVDALRDHFICYEEVSLRHPLLTKYCVRADVVAIPTDRSFWNFPIAFEVKEPNSKDRSAAAWLQAFSQAADYVYGAIEARERADNLSHHTGQRIAAAFVYPGYQRNGSDTADDARFISGAMQLGLHFRVGSASWEKTGIGPRLRLLLGFNEVWRTDCGFCHSGPSLLNGKRRLGSRRINAIAELGGAQLAYPEYE